MLPRGLKVETLAHTRLFNIEAVDLAFSNGRKARFERLMGEGPGAVLVVPLIDAQNLLLVREYAVGLERYELGFVKGRIDRGKARTVRHSGKCRRRRVLRPESLCSWHLLRSPRLTRTIVLLYFWPVIFTRIHDRVMNRRLSRPGLGLCGILPA
ncbi:MAG: hypothetical protein CM1200mP20_10140 [Pseudomonadota bacterium]|nr:MAG: hypothetical protein CM1200mP20_10140 [Pseudomonadota bacterium]